MSIAIVPVVHADLVALRALSAHVIVDTFARDLALQDDIIGNVNQNFDKWLAQPDQCVHLKAVDGRTLVGLVLVRDFWNLCSLFVHPAHQRRGLGRALLEAACVPCAGRSPKGAIYLNAAPNAVAFYRRLGFVERESTRPLPSGGLAMQRPLA